MKPTSLAPFLFLALVACGDDGDSVTPEVDARRVDAATDAPVACTAAATYGDRGTLAPSSCTKDDRDPKNPNDSVIRMFAPLESGMPFDELELQLWAGYGGLTAGIVPGTYPITGDELQFRTCGVCVFIDTDRVDDETYTDDYLATGGTVILTSVDGQLTGTLENLTFEHVTIDGDDMSAPVGDGCVSAIIAGSFTSPIMTLPMNKAQAPGVRPGKRAPRGR